MTDIIRRALRKYVVGALIVACFVGAGFLAAGYFQPAPTVDNSVWKDQHQQQVWKDLQQRRDQLQRDLQQQGPVAPTPAPTTHDTERSI